MTEDNIEIGISTKDGFRKLKRTDVKDYLAALSWSAQIFYFLR